MGRKPSNKKRLNKPEKREKWIRQLFPLFEKEGVSPFSMDEICAILGISKATFYKYFRSREELLESALLLKLEDIRVFKSRLDDDNYDFIERYYNAIEVLIRAVAGISPAFLADLRQHYPDLWGYVVSLQEFASVQLELFYKAGIKAGVFRAIHPGLLSLSDRMFFDALSDPEFLISNKLSIKEAFLEYFKMKCFGIIEDPDRQANMKEILRILSEPKE